MGGPVSEMQIERQELQASTDRCAKQANASAFRLFCMGKGKTSTVEEKSEFVEREGAGRGFGLFLHRKLP